MNSVAAVLAFATRQAPPPAAQDTSVSVPSFSRSAWVYGVTALSGFSALAAEAIWTAGVVQVGWGDDAALAQEALAPEHEDEGERGAATPVVEVPGGGRPVDLVLDPDEVHVAEDSPDPGAGP